ncbi:5'-nucleotidase C-terminal domain-containing protein [Lactococcus termiticola]|uniref:5'-nucleotidase n=1 Tax=Lactococcus termiticola TaxID=2169526 RepID=A0A2R5HGL3_9LACT|nr:5'-nucleotidase C-terminal domain-containing protein [Lactococcus termiticola]GBG97154.1 5'-nucleotidase [Lactococcus termiticola]
MKTAVKIGFATTAVMSLSLVGLTAHAESSKPQDVYRLYNKVNHAHLWTSSSYENSQLPKIDKNWTAEGKAWQQPSSGSAIYRLYNPKSGEHLYTSSSYEKTVLTGQGWTAEGISFHSADKSGQAVYRLYNPAAGVGSHLNTASSYERDVLVKEHGWKYEGIAWYAYKQASPQAEKVPVQILGINDFHGNVATANQKVTLPAITGDPTGKTTDYTGTAAMLAGYLNQASSQYLSENKNGLSLRLEAGDMISASPAQSALIYDQPTIAALHAMKIQVGTLGNHEFDKGLPQLNTIMQGKNPVSNPTSNLDKLAAGFYNQFSSDQLSGGYQIVVANLTNKSDGKIPNGYKPYTILNQKTANGTTVKIGVIGVITQETPSIVLKDKVEAYNFGDPSEAIAKYSKELQAQGINAIVVLGHTASDNTDNDPNKPVYGETADIINKLDKIDPSNSVDLYVAGHSHTFTNGVVGKIRVVQALSFGMAFDNVNATYDTKTQDFTATPTAKIVPTTSYSIDGNGQRTDASVKADATVENIVDKASAITDQIANQPIGKYADGATYRPGNPILSSGRGGKAFLPVSGLPDISGINGSPNISPTDLGESLLGQFITKAQYDAANANNVKVDVAFTNNGGIRADLKKNDDGTITWGQAQAVQPFRNVIQVVNMTGREILAALNEQTYHAPDAGSGSGLFLQEYGIKYSVTTNPDLASGVHPNQSPYVVSKMSFLDGSPVELDKSYHVAINNFLRGGGDGFEAFARPTVTDVTGFQVDDTDIFVNAIQQLGTIPADSSFQQEKSFDSTGSPLK